MNSRRTSILAAQEQLDGRCKRTGAGKIREQLQNLAGTASQVQLLQTETQSLRIEMESLRKRNMYLSVSVLVVFLLAISEFALRFGK